MNHQELHARLEAADPARNVPIGPGDPDAVLRRAAAAADLDPPGRRRALAVAAVALAVVAVITGAAVLLRPHPSVQPAPPPVVPTVRAGCLAELAGQVQPAPYDGVRGAYEYQRQSIPGSRVYAIPDHPGQVAGAYWHTEVQTWRAADGSGRRVTDNGTVTIGDNASLEYFQAHQDQLPTPAAHEDESFGPGRLPAAAELDLSVALPPAQALAKVAELNTDRIPGRDQRAAILRYLAALPGLACEGLMNVGDPGTGLLVTARSGASPAPGPGGGDAAAVFNRSTGELMAFGRTGGRWKCVYLQRNMVNSE
ncbi:hypothetical protein [Dactylosporangium matsuzakiense]|uniref:CU044_5270 family protein n=1 Tax=Dactylosporangium matsuzakiense TaxID=53360 RepID=A0A9W6NIZ6_9ACTN|nr:hypothetical protein [Dactylosporangium matsuzakiense]UWZ47057.1 hypothetical protein Dmats_12025 [Dactylosporangium matsuzakiense]GLK98512.1 hypothetical protein GCM10017581_002530 [Dactylosporangium matsuzakiense]